MNDVCLWISVKTTNQGGFRMQKMTIGWFLIAVFSTACQNDPSPYGTSFGALKPLADCQELESSLKEAAIEQMNQDLDHSLSWALRWKNGGPEILDDAAINGLPAPSPDSGKSNSNDQGANDFSTTNTQETGVDEADFVKNDDQTIYLIAGRILRIFDAWPAPETHQLSSYTLPGLPKRMYVRKNLAIIYSDLGTQGKPEEECFPTITDSPAHCPMPDKLLVTVLDITEKTKPTLVREIEIQGAYVDSRRIDGMVHTVLTFPQPIFPEIRYWPEEFEYHKAFPDFLIKLMFEKLRAKNTKIILNAKLSDWIPRVRDTSYGPFGPVANESLMLECPGFYQPALPAGHGFLSIMTLDLDSPQDPHFSTIIGQHGKVYASTDSLYVATEYWNAPKGIWLADTAIMQEEVTVIHKFSLAGESSGAEYQASGVVPGRILNQFSMGEHEGYLRLATSSGWLGNSDSQNSIFVLEQQSDRLTVAGSIQDIAPGEEIRSARFSGKRGFLVTFKNVDPLFTVDLTDPTHPRLAGELKIPGFSTYMHLMDQDHLLTIGFDAEDAGDFAWFKGIQLQIFDVSDMSKPTRTHVETIGTRGTTSEATANHLAFNYFAPKNLLALPMGICKETQHTEWIEEKLMFSGLMVWDVAIDKGFLEHGRVSFPAPPEMEYACSNWWGNPNSMVKRSVIMDDYVFSISNDLMKINHLDDLSQDITSFDLQ